MKLFRKSEKRKKKEFTDKIRGKQEDKIVKPPTYFACVLEYAENSPEAKVGIAKYSKNGSPQNAKTLTIQEMDKLKDNFEDYIRENYGGGDFRIAFLSPTKEIQATYELSILGPDIKLGKKNKDGDGSGDGKKKKSTDLLIDMAIKVVEKAINGGGGGGGNDVLTEYLLKREDNALTREEGAITTAGGILQLIDSKQPQIAPQNDMAALYGFLGQLAPVLGQILSARLGQQGPPQQAALGAVEQTALIAHIAQAATPDEMKQLQPLFKKAGVTPEQLGALMQQPAPAATGTVNLPAPGTAAPVATAQTQQTPASQVTPDDKTPPEIPPEHMTFHVKLGQLRQAASDGAAPEALADMIIALVESSRLLTPDNPHPLLRELTQSEPTELPAAMTRFFQNIPELSADAGLQQAVGKALWKYATGEDFEETEEETDHADISSGRPAGVRSDGGPGGTDDGTQSGPVGEDNDSARPDNADLQSQVA